MSTVQINSFVKGLITEASPLTFPENASLDEDNFVLLKDGSRRRRLGINFEEGFSQINAGAGALGNGEVIFSSYSWKNPGGYANKNLIVLQFGNIVRVHDADVTPLSSSYLYSKALSKGDSTFSYATVDGSLIIANGEGPVHIFEYDGTSISYSSRRIKIRDQFGVEDIYQSVDLREGQGVTVRPPTLTGAHTYNLRNQSWALPRTSKGDEYREDGADTIEAFYQTVRETTDTDDPDELLGRYPSNADAVVYSIGAWTNGDGILDSADSFLVDDAVKNPPGSFPAPQGYFIIDALKRGSSRLEEVKKLESNNPELKHRVNSLPTDTTPGGPTVVEEYAGRVWYAGFSSRLIDGDSKSPRLSSYVFYSQLVSDPTDITNCYQEGDPTSEDTPDLVDTDGGFMRIDGAYNIIKLINVGSGLVVLAENGIWMISGGSDYGFSANNNMRRKVSEQGATSPSSVIIADNTFFFWADDAIYQIAPDQFGDYNAQNLTNQTIQSFYDEISPADKLYAQGSYDSYERKIRWIYQNRLLENNPTRELILDLNLGSFYTNTLGVVGTNGIPRVVSAFEVPPYRLESVQSEVVAAGNTVVIGGEEVYVPQELRGEGSRELAYLTITDTNPIRYSFSYYRDNSFTDWVSYDGVGADAEAYLVTGYLSGGDFMRYKQAPYIYFYFNRTENGFEEVGGDIQPLNPSSCLVQSQWEWTDSAASNRWGRVFQAYRYKRFYMPTSVADSYDTGDSVIQTRSKLRGKGKVLSLFIKTEPKKDCQLLGWAMLVGTTGSI
tara:strand:+ start:41396 stop:43735 length:2340 start_codon:yes stop_codon:yes gene_type:complete